MQSEWWSDCRVGLRWRRGRLVQSVSQRTSPTSLQPGHPASRHRHQTAPVCEQRQQRRQGSETIRRPVGGSAARVLPIPALRKCQILELVHKFTHHPDKLPGIFSNYFAQNYIFRAYNTRTKDHIHVDLFVSSLGQRSIKYKGSILCNDLPDEIKSIWSTILFVEKLKRILL